MFENLAVASVVVSGFAALGSLAAAVTAILQKRRHKNVDVKLSDGMTVTFDDTMSEKEISDKLERISDEVYDDLGKEHAVRSRAF
jgi:Effector Associated Constant Component 1